MLPDRVSNPGPLSYESGALPIALRGPACQTEEVSCMMSFYMVRSEIRQKSLEREI